MRVIYMGKDKASAIRGLLYLVENGIEVVYIVCKPMEQHGNKTQLIYYAKRYRIPCITIEQLDKLIEGHHSSIKDIDLVISFLYWKRIKQPIITLGRVGCINLHPAPLPDYRGVAGYSFAIYDDLDYWGVTAHFVDENFDTGDIILGKKFRINARNETAFSLERKTQKHLLLLFKQVISMVLKNDTLPRLKQVKGRYVNMEEFEKVRQINPKDTPETIDRKRRAFWFPPFRGAFVNIKGKEYTLVNDFILLNIAAGRTWRVVAG